MMLANGTREPNYLFAPRLGHSAKAYDLIARNSPGLRLSLFQRSPREGFEARGNELPTPTPSR